MRTLISAAVAALAITGAAQAQPTGYYTDDGADYAYRYSPPQGYGANGAYEPDPSRAAGNYDRGYDSGYEAGRRAAAESAAGAAVLGAAIADAAGHPAYDRYGPDPNGTIARDGHMIKCKLVDGWDGYGHWGRHRECW